MNICIIGNSHVGALKKAWVELEKKYPEVDIVFFARGSNSLKDLKVRNGLLVPGNDKLKEAFIYTSGGKEFVDPCEYDVFLVYGLGVGGLFVDECAFFSSSVLRQTCIDHVKSSLSLSVIEKIRSITDKKIYVGHSPLPAVDTDYENSVENFSDYLNGISLLNKYIYSDLGSLMLSQPQKTISNGRFTNKTYSKGSLKLDVGNQGGGDQHPVSDTKHMNQNFGEAWLMSFLATFWR